MVSPISIAEFEPTGKFPVCQPKDDKAILRNLVHQQVAVDALVLAVAVNAFTS